MECGKGKAAGMEGGCWRELANVTEDVKGDSSGELLVLHIPFVTVGRVALEV